MEKSYSGQTQISSGGLITSKYRANPLGRDLNKKYHVLVYHVRFSLIQAPSRHKIQYYDTVLLV